MSTPLVTIVTPSYNQGRFIRATIESVLSQDYPRLEYIIMDGGSTDDTASIVKDYASRLTWISERDRGQTDAINKGFRLANGAIVAWLNSDDIALPGAVSCAAKMLERRPDCGAVYGEGYTIDIDGRVTGRFTPTEPFNLWKLIYVWDSVLQQTVYFRKRVLEEIGYLDETLRWAMDWDVLIRIGMKYPLGYVPEYMGALREYGETKTATGGTTRFRELVRMMRRHGGRRYPPGYFIYGLDTYERAVCTMIDRWTPDILRGVSTGLQRLITSASRGIIGRVIAGAQGWYSDGWATTRVEYLLPASSTGVWIRGSVPDASDALRGQMLRVTCNGRLLDDVPLPVGDFQMTFALPTDVAVSCRHIVLQANRWIVPKQLGLSSDSRRLAYMLHEIQETRSPCTVSTLSDRQASDS